MTEKPTIAIIGGTGDLGSGLARRWAMNGYGVIVGSRDRAKAQAMAKEIHPSIRGDDNLSAAKAGDVVVIAVPFSNHEATLNELKSVLKGKIVVDAVVPLVPPKVSTVQLPPEGSAALIAQKILGPDVKVTSAFHNVGAKKLHDGNAADCDVLVFGDDKDARETVVALAGLIGTAGIDGGVLANSVAAEALTSVLIGINRRYKAAGAGIRITGLSAPAAS